MTEGPNDKDVALGPIPGLDAASMVGKPKDIAVLFGVWFLVSLFALASLGLCIRIVPHFPAKTSLAYGYIYLVVHEGAVLFFLYKYFTRFCRIRNISFAERFYLDSPLQINGKKVALYCLVAVILVFAGLGGGTFSKRVPNPVFLLSTFYSWWVIEIVLIAPVKEEFIFRGFMYPIFKNRYGLYRGMLLTSFIFALMHIGRISNYGWYFFAVLFPVIFLYGMFYNTLVEKEKGLLWSISFHCFNNLLAVLIALIAWILYFRLSPTLF